jgi:hypothetical protein
MNKYPTTVDGLIEVLTKIKEACGGNTYVQVNAFGHDCVTGLRSVCLDNDMGTNEKDALVYIETDLDETCYPATFEFYTQGREI